MISENAQLPTLGSRFALTAGEPLAGPSKEPRSEMTAGVLFYCGPGSAVSSAKSVDSLLAVCSILDQVAILIAESWYDGPK